jgi:putative NADH-flavin reductase
VKDTVTERNVKMKIAVAGATGRVGHHVVDVLHERGHEVVAISRANGVDIITGFGLDAALAGVEVIIDGHRSVTRRAGRHRLLRDRDAEPAGCG